MRQGPHHGAQQSSRMVSFALNTSCWKLASVMVIGLAGAAEVLVISSIVPHLPHFAICSLADWGSTRFLDPHFSQVTTSITSPYLSRFRDLNAKT